MSMRVKRRTQRAKHRRLLLPNDALQNQRGAKQVHRWLHQAPKPLLWLRQSEERRCRRRESRTMTRESEMQREHSHQLR